jgi:hypothetical protein
MRTKINLHISYLATLKGEIRGREALETLTQSVDAVINSGTSMEKVLIGLVRMEHECEHQLGKSHNLP